jgi:hypothetical protein
MERRLLADIQTARPDHNLKRAGLDGPFHLLIQHRHIRSVQFELDRL